jgi:hypothetical protein
MHPKNMVSYYLKHYSYYSDTRGVTRPKDDSRQRSTATTHGATRLVARRLVESCSLVGLKGEMAKLVGDLDGIRVTLQRLATMSKPVGSGE